MLRRVEVSPTNTTLNLSYDGTMTSPAAVNPDHLQEVRTIALLQGQEKFKVSIGQ